MVTLALLMMLAVFAALFLTSSRFDMDASTANIDYVRMDLYAEGIAQYVQSCMVTDLWGFDQIPLNYDGFVPKPGLIPTGMPVDNPFDYFGGRFVLGTGLDAALDAPEVANFGIGTTSLVNRDKAYYPDFWLTSPSYLNKNKFGTATADVAWEHPAFAPYGVTEVMRDNMAAALPRQYVYNSDSDLVATRFGNKAFATGKDTPWLFWKALGNGLYIRAAVRVEDTSNRVNVNVARHPISVVGNYTDLYHGYPSDVASAFPVFGDEVLGRFQSEMNLNALPGAAVGVLDNGLVSGTNIYPGRYGTRTAAPFSWPDGRVPADATISPELVPLFGDTDIASPTFGVPSRMSNSLANDVTAGATWNPAAPVTLDPDALVRRLDAPRANATVEQDRPFGVDDTFDLMSPRTFSSMTGLPAVTRLERMWSGFFSTPASSLIWRPLLTTYSWTLNLCPYGVDPYGDQTYRKLDLNTCTAYQLVTAINGAFDHAVYDGSLVAAGPARITWIDQFAANFLEFRANRAMTTTDLDRYLTHLQKYKTTTTKMAPWQFSWDEVVWNAYIASAGYPTEVDYLNYVTALAGVARATELTAVLTAGVSVAKPAALTPTTGGWTGTIYGFGLSPFFTEVWCNIQYPTDVAAASDPGDITKTNDYAVELFNPWGTALDLKGWYVRVRNSAPLGSPDIVVSLTGTTLPAGARLVVSRRPTVVAAPNINVLAANLVIAKQDPADANPDVDLLYYPGAADLTNKSVDADFAVFDNIPNGVTVGFQGSSVPVPPISIDQCRRDDNNSGFWCYQYWEVKAPTLGSPNGVPFNAAQPWTVTGAAGYGPNPAVPTIAAGLPLSPADLVLVPYGVPQQVHRTGGADATTGTTFADAILATDPTSETTRFQTLGFARPTLFHRKYDLLSGAGGNTGDNLYVTDALPQFQGVFQALMDFVTVTDFTADGVVDGVGTLDPAELRVPGRLNVNTVTEWNTLNGCPNLLLGMNVPAYANFWDRLVNYRDKRDPGVGGLGVDWYPRATPNSRRNNIAPVPILVRDNTLATEDEASFLGFEQLGELCNVQNKADWSFAGFWQNATTVPRFPQQYIRRFEQNANLLSVRSDTYMVTLRVEIVRPVYDTANVLQKIDTFGQREYMYLVDRSYCAKAPQKDLVVGDAAFNGRVNPTYIPPRAWRMSIPSYNGY